MSYLWSCCPTKLNATTYYNLLKVLVTSCLECISMIPTHHLTPFWQFPKMIMILVVERVNPRCSIESILCRSQFTLVHHPLYDPLGVCTWKCSLKLLVTNCLNLFIFTFFLLKLFNIKIFMTPTMMIVDKYFRMWC